MISTLSLLTLSLSVFVFVPGHPVQEDERNSLEHHTNPHSDFVRWSQTGTSFKSTAPVGQEVVRGSEEGRGRVYEGLQWSSGPGSVSPPSSQDQGLLHPTSTLQGLTVAGRADRETLPLPEEEQNNRADTSGAAHLTDGPMSAGEGTHPYFQHVLSTVALFHTSRSANTETNSRYELPQTQMALKRATASSSNTILSTDAQKYTVSRTSKQSVSTQADSTVSSTSVPPLTSSPPELPSWTTWMSGTILGPRGGAVSGPPGKKQPHSWRNQRSTDRLNSDLTSAVTADPLKSPTEPQQGDSSSAHTNTEPTASSSSSQDPGSVHSSTNRTTGPDTADGPVEAASFHPNISGTDSFASAASDVMSQTSAFESSDKFKYTEMLHTFTSPTQSRTDSTESVTHTPPPYTSSQFPQTSKEETQTATQSTPRHFVYAHITTVSSSPDIKKDDDWTFAGSSSAPRGLTLGDVVQNSAATGTTAATETYSLRPAYTVLHDHPSANAPTPLPHFSSSASSTASYTLQTHTTFSGSSHFAHTSSPLPSTAAEPAVHTPLIDHKATSIPSQTSTIKPSSSYTPHTQNHLPLPASTNVPATREHSHNYVTTTRIPLLSLTTSKSNYGREDKEVEEETEDEWFSTTTQAPTARPPGRPPPWTTPHPSQENHTALTLSVLTSVHTWSSTTSQTPKFYIVPDQPATIKGIVHTCLFFCV